MTSLNAIRLKKNEDRRLRAGHHWIFSNEINTAITPIKSLIPGEQVFVEASDGKKLGVAYVNPRSLITGRLFSTDTSERLDTAFFIKKFQAALHMRNERFPAPFYRFVFGESDGLPGLIIDRFDQHFVVQLNTAGMENQKNNIIVALREMLSDIQSILFRNDSGARQFEELENYSREGFGTPPDELTIIENDTQFTAPTWEGQKTGWFYDHRLNRSRLKEYAKHQTVLDVFSYLGGWGIQAAVCGADHVTCIDSSALSATWIPKNAALNSVENKVSVIKDDAFDALKKLIAEQKTFSLIILDPPAFIKKQKDKKEGLIAYQRINELALKLLAPQGILMSCSCSMHLSYDDLIQVIRRASLKTNIPLQVIERGHQGADHPVHLAIPETDYLKMVVVRRS